MRGVPLSEEEDALPFVRRALLLPGISGCEEGMKSGEALPSSSASISSRDRLRGVMAVGMLFDWFEKLEQMNETVNGVLAELKFGRRAYQASAIL